jgi:hypothetical protein
VLSWVSPSPNYADRFNPPKAHALLQGGIIQPTISTGWNDRTHFEFFQRKLDVDLTDCTSEENNNPFTVSGFPFHALLEATPIGSTADLTTRGVPRFINGRDLQHRVAGEAGAGRHREAGPAGLDERFEFDPHGVKRRQDEFRPQRV